ncbi:MAG: hypothetical protein LQ352_000415 [Teloschistes flavicans]|nr:MAG: hypothetical protein LQ352_000415 [Teloschistes flavicans]
MSVLQFWFLSLQTRLSQFVLSTLHDPVRHSHPIFRVAVDCVWVSLDVVSYQPTRDHRKTINAWNTFVLGQDYRLKAALLCPQTRQEKSWRRNHFDLYTAIHETESPRVQKPVDPRVKEPIKSAHRFEVNLEADFFTEEKYVLFENYQYHVHKEGPNQVSREGFKRFLCFGMGQTQRLHNGRRQALGSYHQCYRLDGRLVAMGVLDLLPECVSSVYLIYHQDVKEWSFGKLSALREISLAIEGKYQYYYMGYYIHSCVKMRYKSQYKPTYLLDLDLYSWNLLDADHLARLSARKYVSMSLERQLRLPPRSLTTADNLGLDDEGLTQLRKYLQPGETTGAFGSCMPGIMTLDEVQNEVNFDEWKVKLSDSVTVRLEGLGQWSSWNIMDPSSPKGVIAELAAALGPALVSQFVLDFT